MVRIQSLRKYYLSRKSKVQLRMQKFVSTKTKKGTISILCQISELAKDSIQSKRFSKIKNIFGGRVYFSKKNNCRGQTLIFLVFLLPILGFLISGLGTNLIVLKSKMKQQKLCRESTYNAQRELTEGFKKLKNLNPRALSLRRQKSRALKALRAAKDPYTLAAISAHITQLTIQQSILRAKQKAIISVSKLKAQSQLLKIPGSYKVKSPPFSMVAKPKMSLSPSYFNSINFVSDQEIIINWNIQIPTHLSKINSKSMEGNCGSFVKTKGLLYQIKYSYPDIQSSNYL